MRELLDGVLSSQAALSFYYYCILFIDKAINVFDYVSSLCMVICILLFRYSKIVLRGIYLLVNALSSQLVDTCLVFLMWIYKNGPGYLGMWSGMSSEDICSAITSINHSFWSLTALNFDFCEALIAQKTRAFFIGIFFVLFMCILLVLSILVPGFYLLKR